MQDILRKKERFWVLFMKTLLKSSMAVEVLFLKESKEQPYWIWAADLAAIVTSLLPSLATLERLLAWI